MVAKAYGKAQRDWSFVAKSEAAHKAILAFLRSRPSDTYKITGIEEVHLGVKATITHVAHNEHNGWHDVTRRCAEFLQKIGVDPSRVTIIARSTGTWKPLPCIKHNNHCHTSEHKRCGGRCCKEGW